MGDNMLGKATWAMEFITKDFYNDYPTKSERGYGPITNRWMTQSRNWMKDFLIYTMKCKPQEVIWSKGFYYWTMFAKVGEQWWFFDTGDVRFKTMKSMLVRTAEGPKDFTGGRNQFVQYDDPDFASTLRRLLTPMRI